MCRNVGKFSYLHAAQPGKQIQCTERKPRMPNYLNCGIQQLKLHTREEGHITPKFYFRAEIQRQWEENVSQ
jgi:hypothetical protein